MVGLKPDNGGVFELDALTPSDEIAHADECVHHAEADEKLTMEDPNEHPKPPKASEEPVTDSKGDFDAIDTDGLGDDILDVRL